MNEAHTLQNVTLENLRLLRDTQKLRLLLCVMQKKKAKCLNLWYISIKNRGFSSAGDLTFELPYCYSINNAKWPSE